MPLPHRRRYDRVVQRYADRFFRPANIAENRRKRRSTRRRSRSGEGRPSLAPTKRSAYQADDPPASLLSDAGGIRRPGRGENNEDDEVAGDIDCGVLGGAKAETDKGDEGTGENVGESVAGDSVRMC